MHVHHDETSQRTIYRHGWASLKQKRDSYARCGAEILACTEPNDSDDRAYYLKMSILSLFSKIEMHSEIASSRFYETVRHYLHSRRKTRILSSPSWTENSRQLKVQ